MKILFIPTSYPDEKNSSRNIFIYEQAVALSNAGHEIRILHAQKQPSKNILKKIDKTIAVHNEGYAIRYSCPVKTFIESKFVRINKFLFERTIKKLYVRAVSDGWLPDIIYAHFSCWAGTVAVDLGKKHCIPVAVIEHYGGFLTDSITAMEIQGLKYVVDNADVMLCVSENLKNVVKKRTKSNRAICVLPNMINSTFQYCKREPRSEFVYSAICNLNEGKRVFELVDAFCSAFDENDQVKLLIGGDGPERARIGNYITKKHRGNQISLLGRLDRKGTVNLYKKSDCFALVSAHETFGIVWREAMATGIPVITSNHGGWSKQEWSDKFGIMVPVDDKYCLINALKKIREQYSFYNGVEIAEFCRNHYSENCIIAKLEKAFYQICLKKNNL